MENTCTSCDTSRKDLRHWGLATGYDVEELYAERGDSAGKLPRHITTMHRLAVAGKQNSPCILTPAVVTL